MINDELWQAYSDPYFRFHTQPISQEFAIITAWNPGSVWLPQADNDLNNQHLEQEIDHTSYSIVQVGNETFTWSEASFAVEFSLEQALILGQKYRQNAIYYVQGESLFLVSCLEKRNKVLLGRWRDRCK
ncbi:DUF3293 domain-containing protein [Vibrio sp. TBV020]|uniref:DUF3293 domain-containing protein n=1 Tax=Vibrio sp. TBV020 TaxID=3137398 RepID=UPI0038CD53BA